MESCISHLRKQNCPVKLLPPYLTSTGGKPWNLGNGTRIVAITDKLNEIIDRFQRSSATHVWIVNADIEVPSEGLCRLLKLDVDVASGVYPRHSDGAIMIAGLLSTEPRLSFNPLKREEVEGRVLGENELVAAGDGCLLIKRRVIERFTPYYKPLRFRGGKGEPSDLLFFADAQSLGFTVRLDGNVICGHRPEFPLEG